MGWYILKRLLQAVPLLLGSRLAVDPGHRTARKPDTRTREDAACGKLPFWP